MLLVEQNHKCTFRYITPSATTSKILWVQNSDTTNMCINSTKRCTSDFSLISFACIHCVHVLCFVCMFMCIFVSFWVQVEVEALVE